MMAEVLLIKNKARLEKMIKDNYPTRKINMQKRKVKKIEQEIKTTNYISKQ